MTHSKEGIVVSQQEALLLAELQNSTAKYESNRRSEIAKRSLKRFTAQTIMK